MKPAPPLRALWFEQVKPAPPLRALWFEQVKPVPPLRALWFEQVKPAPPLRAEIGLNRSVVGAQGWPEFHVVGGWRAQGWPEFHPAAGCARAAARQGTLTLQHSARATPHEKTPCDATRQETAQHGKKPCNTRGAEPPGSAPRRMRQDR